MKRIISIIIVLSSILLMACGPGKDRVRIKGKYKNLRTAQFLVYSNGGALDRVDTIKLYKGEFDITLPIDTTCLLELVYPNLSHTTLVAERGATIALRADAHDLSNAEVDGTDDNRRLTRFRQKMNKESWATRQMAAQQYIRDHVSGVDAVAVYASYFVAAPKCDVKVAEELLTLLRKHQPQDKMLQTYARTFLPRLRMRVGERMPAFTAQQIAKEGKAEKPYQFVPVGDKNTLLVVWASWQMSSPTKLYETLSLKQKSKEPLRIISLALDPNKVKVRRMMEDMKWDAVQLIDTLAMRSPLVELLSIDRVPKLIYVDRKGVLQEVPSLADYE